MTKCAQPLPPGAMEATLLTEEAIAAHTKAGEISSSDAAENDGSDAGNGNATAGRASVHAIGGSAAGEPAAKRRKL